MPVIEREEDCGEGDGGSVKLVGVWSEVVLVTGVVKVTVRSMVSVVVEVSIRSGPFSCPDTVP